MLEGKHEIVDQEVFGVACTCAPWLYTNLLWSSTLVYLFNVNVFKQANSLLLHVLGSWIAGSGPLPFLPFKTTDLRRLGQEAEGEDISSPKEMFSGVNENELCSFDAFSTRKLHIHVGLRL